MRKLNNPCMASGRSSLNWPGSRDHCEACGRVVRTRKKDGTYQPHNLPEKHT